MAQTPKEKAEELFYKFRNIESDKSWVDNVNAKKCALIAVDEIIGSVVITNLTVAENQFKYWEEVKEEINNL